MELKPIAEQVAVIVGASSGIGRQTALDFAREGASVVVAARSEDALASLVREIRSDGGEATAVVTDVSEYGQVQALAERAVREYGRIDTWVHLAAVGVWSRFEEMTPDEWKRIVDVNLNGQAYGAMAALPYLRREGRGALIHVSSGEARFALPYQSAYAASKHGLRGFLKALRLELKQEKVPISVTEVLPAGINTPFYNRARTRIGVKPRPMPPVYQPQVVADAIRYAAAHPVEEIVAGGAARAAFAAQAVAPRLWEAFLLYAGFQAQRTDQRKSDRAPDNLFQALPGESRCEGDFGGEARSASVSTWLAVRPGVRRVLAAALLGSAAAVLAARSLRATPDGTDAHNELPGDEPEPGAAEFAQEEVEDEESFAAGR